MIKVAITGFSGYIAGHLEKVLRKYEYSVIGIRRELLYSPMLLEEFYQTNQPQFTIHTAAYGNKFDQTNDYETIVSNILPLMNLLEVTKSFNYAGFINFSSSSVALPYETFYSASKGSGERIVRAFVNKYQKPVVNVRPFTVIGNGEQKEHLIPKLIESCQTNCQIPFVPDPTHDFIGVTDFCEAIAALLQYTQALKGQTIDIGTGVSTTNEQIRMIVESKTGKKANIDIKKSLRPYDTKEWKANPVILESLGWKPKQTLDQIIEDMVRGNV